LTDRAWQIEHTVRVNSVTNHQHTSALEDDVLIEDLVSDPVSLDGPALAQIKQIATSDPLLVNKLVSPSGHVTAVLATLILPQKGSGERTEPVRQARELATAFETEYPQVEVYLTGGALLSHIFSEYTAADLALLTPIMYLVIVVLLAVTLRSVTATVGATFVIMASTITAMGMTSWTGLMFTAPAAAMPSIVMTLAVADSVHILVTMLREMRAGRTKHEALIESFRVNLHPVFLTTLTTCIGFLSMNLSTVPPLQHFGNMTAMGVVAAFFFSVVSLPALLSVLPMRVKVRPEAAAKPGVERLAEVVIRHRTPLLWGPAVFTLVLAACIPLNDFKNNWVLWFDESTAFRQDLAFVTENLSGINAIEYSVPASGPGAIGDPEYLSHLDEYSSWWRRQPHVNHVSTVTDIVRQLNKAMHGDDPEYYRVPKSPELAAQYLLLYEMSLPLGQDLNNQINVDKSATRVQVITEDVDSTVVDEMRLAGEQWLEENAPPYMRSHGTGSGPLFASMADETIKSLFYSTPAAIILICLVMMVIFRSVRYGLLSLVPNLAPIVMAFGAWGLLVGTVDFGMASVGSQAIGIVVDDTIHFMTKYLRARREHGYSAEDAVRYAFRVAGRAIWVTSFVLVMGFVVLTFSVFEFNAHMGMLAAITITFALLADLFLLPALLLRFDKR
ncbi:MAG: MMPL family transporter, partial [Candidatus Hydrogenedentales bacterium]